MPRTKQYTPDETIDAIMGVFWRKGFSEASYEDMVAASGVSRKGLYGTFGDKEALFSAALQRYRLVVSTLLSDLENPEIGLSGIVQLIVELADFISGKEGRMGCFMANTALDDAIRIDDVRRAVTDHMALMSSTFSGALIRAGVDPAEAAVHGHFLTGTMQGLFLLGRAGVGRKMIKNYIAAALSLPVFQSRSTSGKGPVVRPVESAHRLNGFARFKRTVKAQLEAEQ